MLHVISARCVTRDLHTIAAGPLERTCWRQFATQWGDCKKSRIAPLNVIVIVVIIIIIFIIFIIIIIIIIIIIKESSLSKKSNLAHHKQTVGR